MEATTKKTKLETVKTDIIPVVVPMETMILHSAITIDGKTESTLNKAKLPGIIEMGWGPNFQVGIIRTHHRSHYLPAAAFKDSSNPNT